MENKKDYYAAYRLKNKEKIKQAKKTYRLKNKEKIKEKQKEYYKNNKENLLLEKKKYHKLNKNNILQKKKEYYAGNKEKILIKNKNYHKLNKKKIYNSRKQNINLKISNNLRSRIRKAIKNKKGDFSLNLIGCSIKEVRNHLQSLFKDNMSWENYGYKGWHIDHIKPCALFDLTDPEQQKECFHYTNLQPLWSSENFIKSNKFVEI